jgi:outer membrane protein
LPVELKRVQVRLVGVRQQLAVAKADDNYAEGQLALALGFPEADRVHPVETEPLPDLGLRSEDECVNLALENSRDLRRLQSNILARELEIGSQKAARLPQVNLVAQYSLFATYNNFQDYFKRFQRNNAELGVSVAIPILVGPSSKALAAQAAVDVQKLRIELNQLRNRIALNSRRDYQLWKTAEGERNLARMQLDLAREDLSVLLAQMWEGRTPVSRVEQARVAENDRWIALYDDEIQVERARLVLLRDTGNLVTAMRTRYTTSEKMQP